MNKKSVMSRLSSLKTPLMAVGVSQLGLFGSTVRGENTSKQYSSECIWKNKT